MLCTDKSPAFGQHPEAEDIPGTWLGKGEHRVHPYSVGVGLAFLVPRSRALCIWLSPSFSPAVVGDFLGTTVPLGWTSLLRDEAATVS